MVAGSIPWRWREESGATVVPVEGTSDTRPADADGTVCFALDRAEFAIGMQLELRADASSCTITCEMQYCHEGGAGESSAPSDQPAAWFGISSIELEATEAWAQHQIFWPDVGAHKKWRVVATSQTAHTFHMSAHSLLVWCFQVRLDVAEAFPASVPADVEQYPGSVGELIAAGDVVIGNNELLSQLYHEGDLLGWGTDIRFPAFFTIWAKRQTPHDFASLIHRFERVRAPTLVLSGTSVAQRSRLRNLLKPLLRPEFAELVRGLEDPDEIIAALWDAHEPAGRGRGGTSAASAMEEANGRIRAAYERLQVPEHLQQAHYTPQFKKHDPLMLLLSHEAFGSWGPNRVAAELGGTDIFRTFAQFAAVDGIVTSEEAVWLFDASSCYRPAPDPRCGDKRSLAFRTLLREQRPWIEALLREYHARGWVDAAFVAGLHGALLAPPQPLHAHDDAPPEALQP
mmetsp:Transcript_23800/g.48051  ORF Transcript_23800/g.48051 Transcript_23800/m.48051 type:complete len:457 (+) Transcript_23800:98-1468(+)